MKQLFVKKSLDAALADETNPSNQLNRAIGAGDVVLLGIGAIVGAGIFATIGTAAAGDALRPGAGPALMLSFVLTSVACGFSALCYAEFAAMVPVAGSAYTYAYVTLGELVAWIIGWDLIIEYAVGNVAVAISWSNYFSTFLGGLGIYLPAWLQTDYRSALQTPSLLEQAPHLLGLPIVCNLLAASITGFITLVLVLGIKESTRTNAIMVMLKLVVLGLFIAVGAGYVQPANWVPFAPNGWAGIRAGAAIVFFAYIGFDAVSTVAEEVRQPARDLPIGIIGSLIACTVIYIIVAAVFTGIVPYRDISVLSANQQAEPLAVAMSYLPNNSWRTFALELIAFGSVVAHTAVLLVFQLGQSRIFFAMARDGLLPQCFAKLHPTFRTPHVVTLITGAIVAVTALFSNLEEVVDLTNIGTLFAFMLVCLGVLILRRRAPDHPRGFRVPWVPAVPLLGIASCLYLIFALPWITWLRFTAWLIVGLCVYFGFGFRKSRLQSSVDADSAHPVNGH